MHFIPSWPSWFISQEVTQIYSVFLLKVLSVPGNFLAAVFGYKSFTEQFLPEAQLWYWFQIFLSSPEIWYHVGPTVQNLGLNLNFHEPSVVESRVSLKNVWEQLVMECCRLLESSSYRDVLKSSPQSCRPRPWSAAQHQEGLKSCGHIDWEVKYRVPSNTGRLKSVAMIKGSLSLVTPAPTLWRLAW